MSIFVSSWCILKFTPRVFSNPGTNLGLQAIDGGSRKQLLLPELADFHVVDRQQGFFPARPTGGGSHGKGD